MKPVTNSFTADNGDHYVSTDNGATYHLLAKIGEIDADTNASEPDVTGPDGAGPDVEEKEITVRVQVDFNRGSDHTAFGLNWLTDAGDNLHIFDGKGNNIASYRSDNWVKAFLFKPADTRKW